MAKRIKALVLAAVLVLTLVAAPGVSFNSYAVDATSSASTWAPAPAPTPAPVKPAPTAPVATPTKPAVTAPTTVATAPGAVIPTITRVLHFGSTGADVVLLQKYLTTAGHAVTADGMFGNLTLNAVKAFQAKAGLTADGIFGPASNKALSAVAGTPAAVNVDVVTTASLVNDIAAFKAGIAADGEWIVTTLGDLVSKEELVLTGTFKNGKKDKVTGEDVIARKIGLYTQDADKNVTARFSLTAPKLTIESPNARIQSGTFIGDVYVNAENFQLVDATVEGNVYYLTQAVKDTAKIDAKSKVTGEVALIEIIEGTDVVATASLTYDNDTFKKSMYGNGTWIISTLKDMTFDKPLVLAGDLKNGKKDKVTGADLYQRKIALYSQDADKKVTRRFTVTAPSLTVLSNDGRIQGGIFVGDVYVTGNRFQLVDATVKGNIYFTTQAAKDSFKADAKSVILGEQILTQPDAVVSPSLYRDEETLLKNISKDGTWIIYAGNDVKTTKNLFLLGEFKNGEKVDRKIALYSQDEKRATTRRFSLTAPMLVIGSPSARLEKGTFNGDLYVNAPNFKMTEMVVNGDIHVSAKAIGFTTVKGSVSGSIIYDSKAVKDAAKIDALTKIEGVQAIQ
jgi:peptidoglycan hydrolase-like protein with peptidoglycan-binding domain